jgi:SAM-dependent methyltransferase
MSEIRLDIGAGPHRLPDFIPVDCKNGGEAFPLSVPEMGGAVPDQSVDEIRASHVLEHFSHLARRDVLAEWVRVLKPGGKLRIAVPDFDRIIAARAAGMPWPIEQYLMGGHTDDADMHGGIFDEPGTARMMRTAGLRSIRRWRSEIPDCASLPISLNLEGIKAPKPDCSRTLAIMSVPRLGFIDNFRCAQQVLPQLGIPDPVCKGGAFWHKALTHGIEEAIAAGAQYVLTLDYDSVFGIEQVEDLHRLMEQSDADAVCAMQAQRGRDRMLLCTHDDQGQYTPTSNLSDFDRELVPLLAGHFGLTLIRASAFASLGKPWLTSLPDANGEWGEESTDADMVFWQRFRAAGRKLYLAAHVPVGHAQLMVTWPSQTMQPLHQYPDVFHRSGMPLNVRR